MDVLINFIKVLYSNQSVAAFVNPGRCYDRAHWFYGAGYRHRAHYSQQADDGKPDGRVSPSQVNYGVTKPVLVK